METMETIRTMEELSSKSKQVNLYSVLSGRIWDDQGRDWVTYFIHPELRTEICKIISTSLQGRKYDYARILVWALVNKYRHPLMEWFILTTYDGKTRWEYVAGQDYNSELAAFRKWLRSVD